MPSQNYFSDDDDYDNDDDDDDDGYDCRENSE